LDVAKRREKRQPPPAHEPWERRDGESSEAYAAFCSYYLLPAQGRSIDTAWRANQDQNQIDDGAAQPSPEGETNGRRAPSEWFRWSSKYEWVARAAAYDDHLADQDRLAWEDRRRQLRQRDWEQADALRGIVDAALPGANQFLRRRTTTLRGQPTVVDVDGNVIQAGAPDREVTTLAFDIAALARVLSDASKLQRLAADEPTETIGLSGAALHDAIERGLAALADKRAKSAPRRDQPRAGGGGKAG
jgi:hypothetical protein